MIMYEKVRTRQSAGSGKAQEMKKPQGRTIMGDFYDPETRQSIRAHRYAYIQAHGAIPQGFQVDHLCDNPPCVNPRHLKAVTPADNRLRSHIMRKHIIPLVWELALHMPT